MTGRTEAVADVLANHGFPTDLAMAALTVDDPRQAARQVVDALHHAGALVLNEELLLDDLEYAIAGRKPRLTRSVSLRELLGF